MLSDVTCKAVIKESKASGKQIKKADRKGLYLHAYPNGSAYWRYKYRILGKEKKLALGVYPEISLAEARDKHNEAHKLVAAKQDPAEIKQAELRNAKAENDLLFKIMADEWYNLNIPRWEKKYADTVKRRLETDLYPSLGELPIKKISGTILLETLQIIEKREAYEMARRALSNAGQVFRYCIAKGLLERDPSEHLSKLLIPYKKGHHKAIEGKDIPDFIYKLDRNEMNLSIETRNLVEMMLLTFVRTSELIKAEKKHFDFEENLWSIPAEMMKMNNDHIVPLSRQTLAIIKKQIELYPKSPFLFPSKYKKGKTMSNGTILSALDSMGYKETHTGHGFRALGLSTIKEKLKYAHDIVDRQLAHKPKGSVDQAYDRAKYLDERTLMMQDWADYIDECRITGLKNVIKISAK